MLGCVVSASYRPLLLWLHLSHQTFYAIATRFLPSVIKDTQTRDIEIETETEIETEMEIETEIETEETGIAKVRLLGNVVLSFENFVLSRWGA